MMSRVGAGDKWNKDRKYRYRYPAIRVGMTDCDVIERAAAMFGTKVYQIPIYNPQRKQAWKAGVTGEAAAVWMQALRPWLGERRSAKVDEILTEYEAFPPANVRRREACRRAAAKRGHEVMVAIGRQGGIASGKSKRARALG